MVIQGHWFWYQSNAHKQLTFYLAPFPSYDRLLVKFSLSIEGSLTLTPPLRVIPCKYPDKLYLSGNSERLSYQSWKPHDRIYIRLDTIPERDRRTDRRTDGIPLATKATGNSRFETGKFPRSAKNSRKFLLSIKLNYHSLCITSTLYMGCIPYGTWCRLLCTVACVCFSQSSLTKLGFLN